MEIILQLNSDSVILSFELQIFPIFLVQNPFQTHYFPIQSFIEILQIPTLIHMFLINRKVPVGVGLIRVCVSHDEDATVCGNYRIPHSVSDIFVK
jgi:hypothetical protein